MSKYTTPKAFKMNQLANEYHIPEVHEQLDLLLEEIEESAKNGFYDLIYGHVGLEYHRDLLIKELEKEKFLVKVISSEMKINIEDCSTSYETALHIIWK